MKNIEWVLIVCILIEECTTNDGILQQVHVFFRHGKRYPTARELYPTDPHRSLFKPELLEQLTEIGKEESCLLGNAFRLRFGALIGNTYNAMTIVTKTSGTSRTIESAQLVLNGLFSECNRYVEVPPNYSITSNIYKFQQPRFICPLYKEQLELLLRQNETQNILNCSKELLEHLSKQTGRSITSLLDVLFLYGALSMEKYLNLSIPQWAETTFSRITNLAVARLQSENGNGILKKLNGGRLLKDLTKNMKGYVEGLNKEKKIFLYSGHEFNLFSLLTVLTEIDSHVPKCNSALAFELYKMRSAEDYYVKLVYFEDVFLLPTELKIKNCSSLCSFSEYEDIVRPFLPTNYTKECQSDTLLE